MTYCVGLKLNHCIISMSDTRTNAGVDNVSTFQKMFHFVKEGERAITIMTAGNLATTQAVISNLEERNKSESDRNPSIMQAPTMFQVAKIIGETLREVISDAGGEGPSAESTFSATLIVSGQIQGGRPCLFLIYPEGNFIEASEDTPFLQIGETKYGRPILVRAFESDMSVEDAVRLLLVSFDSTVKANLSVAPPFDLSVVENDQFKLAAQLRIEANDAQYLTISQGWSDAIKLAIEQLPDVDMTRF